MVGDGLGVFGVLALAVEIVVGVVEEFFEAIGCVGIAAGFFIVGIDEFILRGFAQVSAKAFEGFGERGAGVCVESGEGFVDCGQRRLEFHRIGCVGGDGVG